MALHPNAKFRVGGSGYTAFQWRGHVIAFAQSVRHMSPRPVAQPVPIQPMDERYPVQIVTPAALSEGTLEVTLFERYNEKVWDAIMRKTDNAANTYNDLVQIFITLAALKDPINCVKVINPPTLRGEKGRPYGDLYHNCVITDIRDDENIEIGSMAITKPMTIMYTHMTRIGSGNKAINTAELAPTDAFAKAYS